MSLTKDHLIVSLGNQLHLSKTRSAELIESLLEIVKKKLENGEDLLITGFGKFCVREKEERTGRNPATGEDLMLKQRRVVTLRCSKVLRDKINGE